MTYGLCHLGCVPNRHTETSRLSVMTFVLYHTRHCLRQINEEELVWERKTERQGFPATSQPHRSHKNRHRTPRVLHHIRTVEHRFEVVPATPKGFVHKASRFAVPRRLHLCPHCTAGICLQLPSSN